VNERNVADYDHWMRFHIGDYLADTLHLTALQHGIYLLLIVHYFRRRALPDDEASLARIVKLPIATWRRQSPPVLALFKQGQKGLSHPRIDTEIERAANLSAIRAEAGQKGGKARFSASKSKANALTDSPARPCDRGPPRASEPEPSASHALNPTPDGVGLGGADRSHADHGRKGSRANGTNPRAVGTNPRANGTSPRAAQPSRNGMVEIIREDMEAEAHGRIRSGAPESDPRSSGATVVAIARHPLRRRHEP
jgi:uncharacterized protein YdaU (DUF1376 family)